MNQKLCSLKSYLIYNFYIIIRKWEYSSITLLFIQSFKKHFNCLKWHCVLQILHFVEIYDFEWWISWKNLNYLEEIANLRLRSFMDRLFCNLWQKFKLQINFDLVTSMKRKIISTRLWWYKHFYHQRLNVLVHFTKELALSRKSFSVSRMILNQQI